MMQFMVILFANILVCPHAFRAVYRLLHRTSMSGTIDKNRSLERFIFATFVASSWCLTSTNVNGLEIINSPRSISKNTLKASDVLKSDILPKVNILKDIELELRKFPGYLESRDYQALRSSLRKEPSIYLRKTCKALAKYLPSDDSKIFLNSYQQVIKSINQLDEVRNGKLCAC